MDNEDGVIVDHNLEPGNPADAPQLARAVERVIARTGRKPRTVTADRTTTSCSPGNGTNAPG